MADPHLLPDAAQRLVEDNANLPLPNPHDITPDVLFKRKLKEDLMNQCGIAFNMDRPVYRIPGLTLEGAMAAVETAMGTEGDSGWNIITAYTIAQDVRTPRAIFPRRAQGADARTRAGFRDDADGGPYVRHRAAASHAIGDPE